MVDSKAKKPDHSPVLCDAEKEPAISGELLKEYTARISDIFRELIPDLFEETAQGLETMRQSMDEGDTDNVARLAHGLKGAAGNYELFELGEIFRAIETANHNGQSEEMLKNMAEADRYLKTVRIEYVEEE